MIKSKGGRAPAIRRAIVLALPVDAALGTIHAIRTEARKYDGICRVPNSKWREHRHTPLK